MPAVISNTAMISNDSLHVRAYHIDGCTYAEPGQTVLCIVGGAVYTYHTIFMHEVGSAAGWLGAPPVVHRRGGEAPYVRLDPEGRGCRPQLCHALLPEAWHQHHVGCCFVDCSRLARSFVVFLLMLFL